MMKEFNLFEILSESNLETFDKQRSSRREKEELLCRYIDKFLEAPLEQKKELKELILLCLESYKTFIAMQKEAMRVSEKLTPTLIERRLVRKPDSERLN